MRLDTAFTESEAKELLVKDVDQLYELLGMRIQAVEEDVTVQAQFAPDIPYSDHMGCKDDLLQIGRRMFNKGHVQTYGLICGTDPKDATDRGKFLGSLAIGVEGTVVTLAGILVTELGIAAAFAGVVAALIVKRFVLPVFKEGHEALCEYWREYLPSTSEP